MSAGGLGLGSWLGTMPARRIGITAAVALSATAVVAVVPGLRFAYVSATTRVAMETGQAVIAVVVALLVLGRFRRDGSRLDRLLVAALVISAVSNLFTVVVRASSEDRSTLSDFASWSSLGFSLVAAGAYAAAGHVPDRKVPPAARGGWASLGAVAATCGAVWLVAWAVAGVLPPTVTGDFGNGGASRPALDGSVTAYVVHVAVLMLLVAAVFGFVRRAEHGPHDDLLAAVGLGLVLAAVARLNFILYPSVHTTVVHVGDVVRLAFYLVLLGGAVREISSYWRDRTQLAVLEERRRIARDLHDGMMQELSFIRSQVSAFERQAPTPATIGFVTAAAESALAESRRAVQALSDDDTDALDRVVRRAVEDVTHRARLPVRFALEPGIHADPATTEQFRSIVREATTNAIRHAHASGLTVSLRAVGDRIRLTVTDDGRGFDCEAPVSGFGLRGMRERAGSVGGTITVSPGAHGGTTVCAEVPAARLAKGQVVTDHPDEIDGVA